jgi:hypothetical protein
MKSVRAYAAVTMVLMLILYYPQIVKPASATENGTDWWRGDWHNNEDHTQAPINLSTTVTLTDSTCRYMVKAGLVVSVYQYEPYYNLSMVNFRMALYFDSSVTQEDLIPVGANYVNFYLDKDPASSNLTSQCISVEESETPPGFSEGRHLVQTIHQDSNASDRLGVALVPLSFLACAVFGEAVEVPIVMIELANAWLPQPGVDFQNAGWNDMNASIYWNRPIPDVTENPLREYCFNAVRWFQDYNVNPSDYYGLSICARVALSSDIFGTDHILMPPITLRINRNVRTLQMNANGLGTTDPPVGTYTYDYGTRVIATATPGSGYVFLYWNLDVTPNYSNPITVDMYSYHALRAFFLQEGGGGGGCPTLLVWNSSGYNDFGVINIHNPDGDYDVVKEVPLPSDSVGITNYVAKIRLREGWEGLNYSHSAFDQVKLYAVVGGTRYLCPLFYANHSTLGNVLLPLMFSDDWKVDAYLMETVDLKFLVPYQNVQEYVFVIEGINHFKR